MKKLCGSCSQKEGLSLEERIALALSRLPLVVYLCPICKQEHVNTVEKATRKIPNEAEQEKGSKSRKKNKIESDEPEQMQLELF